MSGQLLTLHLMKTNEKLTLTFLITYQLAILERHIV